MERMFTRDVGRNFKRGDIRDYPAAVWRDIARSARSALDKITRTVDDAARSTLKGADK